MAFQRLFDDKIIEDRNRRTKYTQWSERAIVVGYNGDTQTYDVVVTTERLAGVSKRTLNKTIRNVKSTIPGQLATFSPGDAVLVGYINDQREHPIIIGGGGNVVQEAAIVTIGSGTSEVEGGGEELQNEEGYEFVPIAAFSTPGCLDAAGLTTCDVDCSLENPFVTVTAQGGRPPYSFAVTLPAGCCVTQEISGVNNEILTITPTAPAGISGDTAYQKLTCHVCLQQSSPANGCLCGYTMWSRTYDCLDNAIASGTQCSVGGFFSFTAGKKACCPLVGETQLACGSNDPFGPSPIMVTCTTCASCTGCVGCGNTALTDFIPQAPFADPVTCGSCDRFPLTSCCNTQDVIVNDLELAPLICGESRDVRSEAEIDTGTCCPCGLLFGGLPVTVIDFDGNAITITLTVKDPP